MLSLFNFKMDNRDEITVGKSKLKHEKRNIIWIDQNIESESNKSTLKNFKKYLDFGDFKTFSSVDKAFSEIQKNKNYSFSLFYVIVSGRLGEEFFKKYKQKTEELNILSANIVYCMNKKAYETKPYYCDNFLNHGKIVTSPNEVINYIRKDECQWNNKNKMGIKPEKYISQGKGYGNVFVSAKNINEICIPIKFGESIKSEHIKKNELEEMQKFLLKYYQSNDLVGLIKPSKEKNIDIPYYILAKFFINLYTKETDFYRNLNKDLSWKDAKKYKPFILILYNALNEKKIKNYRGTLYRGATLKEKELENLENVYKQSKNLSQKNNIIYYFTNNFLSFSKSEKEAHKFLKNVKFIIKGIDDNNFFVPNLDIKEFSQYGNVEEEVLVLPFSCFEIKNIRDTKVGAKKIKEITLNYLNNRKKEMNEYIDKISEEDMNKFKEDNLNCQYTIELIQNLGISEESIKSILNNLKNNYNSSNINIPQNKVSKLFKGDKPVFDKSLNTNYNNNQINNGYLNKAQLHNLLENKPVSMQHVINPYNKDPNINPRVMLTYKDGSKAALNYNPKTNQYQIVTEFNTKGEMGFNSKIFKPYNELGKPIPLEEVKTGDMLSILNEAKQKNPNLNLNEQIESGCENIKQLNNNLLKGYTANAIGNAAGNFLVNIDRFIDADPKEKCIMGVSAAAPIGVCYLLNQAAKISTTAAKGAPVVGALLSGGFLVYNAVKDGTSDTFTKSEVAISIGKNVVGTLTDIGGAVGGMELGAAIGSVVPGIGNVVGMGIGGLIGGVASALFRRFVLESKLKLKFCSSVNLSGLKNNSYFGLEWENPSNEGKSFAIELVDNNNNLCWRVINIPPKNRYISSTNASGGTVAINYKGIPQNSYSAKFVLFEVKNEYSLSVEDWKNAEKIQKILIQLSILEVK